ncbi:siroheme decarboxylase subunit beta [Natranaeroarchaeum aerophilus]|uniref:siroheme decarboxylase n=1 Tax=Natranaeroarchaeum aerophilus TaxID=2917711 RepID=A0AAE3FUK3_9EURY|nr:Lrp/AsnC family transcriptional regulator [Natranaeroarchaeum aerophilus]MCL9815225.1 Lrp/AsnC family transcriptional regulator [Natranaeroarchaeum aerophilus]
MTGATGSFDEIDAVLLDGYQNGFPVVERPFEAIARETSYTADVLFERLQSHVDSGLVRRIGPVLDPSAIGASTLAALQVHEEAFAEVAEVVNEFPEVTHNYRRDNEWNMWFVITASASGRLDEVLTDIESRTGYDPLSLPRQRQYCLDLQFPVVADRTERATKMKSTGSGKTASTGSGKAGSERTPSMRSNADRQLTTHEREVLERIQDGFAISETPYRTVASELDVDVTTVLSTIRRLLGDGFLKRVGIVINHHAAGFTSNCMLAWRVPPERIDEVGERASNQPYVTKCYRRADRSDRDWSYSLFTMLHGREESAVSKWIDELATDIVQYPCVKLETVERLKQTGTQYSDLLDP